MPVDPGTLERALGVIKKTYGEGAIKVGSEKPILARLSTGSLGLDYAIGGGVPLGRFCHWYGGKGSAKTLIAYNTIASAQRAGKVCAYYNLEKQFDPVWAAKHGIDVDALHVIDTTIIEEVGATCETLLGSVHVHVIDSVAFGVSMDELATKNEEWRPGISARAWGKVIRRLNNRFDDSENTVIFINQLRKTFGGYGSGEEPTGGLVFDYISRLSLLFRKSGWLFHDKNGILSPDAPAGDSLTHDKEPDGIEFQVRVQKTAGFGRPDRTARLRLDYHTGEVDELWTLAEASVYFDIAEKSGSWYTLQGEKVQGKAGLREIIANDEKLQGEIRTRLMEAA